MLRNSFQARIAGVLVMLLLVVIGALYVAVQAATDAAVRSQAREQLDVGSLVFQRLLEMRAGSCMMQCRCWLLTLALKLPWPVLTRRPFARRWPTMARGSMPVPS